MSSTISNANENWGKGHDELIKSYEIYRITGALGYMLESDENIRDGFCKLKEAANLYERYYLNEGGRKDLYGEVSHRYGRLGRMFRGYALLANEISVFRDAGEMFEKAANSMTKTINNVNGFTKSKDNIYYKSIKKKNYSELENELNRMRNKSHLEKKNDHKSTSHFDDYYKYLDLMIKLRAHHEWLYKYHHLAEWCYKIYGDVDMASSQYVKKYEALRSKLRYESKISGITLRQLSKRGGYFLWRWSCKYGESFSLLFLVASVVVGLFSFSYMGKIDIIPNDLELKYGDNIKIGSVTDSLYTSFSVFTSYSDVHPLNNLAKIIVGLEIFSGYFMLAALVSIIIRKITRN